MKEIFNALKDRIEDGKGTKYATFDFDKTCINNDIQEMLYVYQAENFRYDMTADEFKERLPISDHILEEFGDIRARVKEIEDETGRLYERMVSGRDEDSTVPNEFAACMLALLEIANAKCKNIFTYRWVLRFLEKMTNEEISLMAGKVLDINRGMERYTILYHTSVLSRVEMTPSLRKGTKINENTIRVMQFLAENGVDVYIVSASSYEAVSGAISSCKYSKLVTNDKILALEIHPEEICDYITIDEGKEAAINTALRSKYNNSNPIMAMGDSSGDFWMMKMLGEEGIRIVVGNNKKLHRLLQDAGLTYYTVEESK